MQLQDMLYSQGFGIRRVCSGLVQQGWVELLNPQTSDWEKVLDSTQQVDPEGLRFRVQGVEWEYHELGYVLLNKPAGTECSQKPSAYPSIYTLLPAPLRQRPNKGAVQGVQAVGRLDQDTTGMLLLSDDGQFIHRMSSPKKHVPKVSEVVTKHPATDAQVQRLLDAAKERPEFASVTTTFRANVPQVFLDLDREKAKAALRGESVLVDQRPLGPHPQSRRGSRDKAVATA